MAQSTFQSALQYPDPASGREPARGRLVPTFKRDTIDSYRRETVWTVSPDNPLIYKAESSVPFAWNNRQVLLRISGAPAGYTLRVNGRRVGHVTTGALAAEFNLTKFVQAGSSAKLELELMGEASPVRCLEDFGHPHQVLATELISQPTIRVRDVVVETRKGETGFLGEVGIVVKCDALNEKSARIRYELLDTAGVVVKQGFEDIRLRMRGEDTLRFVYAVPEHLLWSPESPLSYRLRLSTQSQGRYTEYLNLPIGFRHVALQEGVLQLNGRPLAAKPYIVDRPLTAAEVADLKARGYDLLLPLPDQATEALYMLADEAGICVVAQSPICTERSGDSRLKEGNPSNDPARVAEYGDRAQSARHLAQRHPSVVGFAIGHRSANGIALYESFLALKRVEHQLPIFYFDAQGEWNHDYIQMSNE